MPRGSTCPIEFFILKKILIRCEGFELKFYTLPQLKSKFVNFVKFTLLNLDPMKSNLGSANAIVIKVRIRVKVSSLLFILFNKLELKP